MGTGDLRHFVGTIHTVLYVWSLKEIPRHVCFMERIISYFVAIVWGVCVVLV